MSFLENGVPPPLVAAACAGAMWVLAVYTPPVEIPRTLRIAAASVAFAAGLSVMLAGVVSFRRAATTVNPMKPETATALVTGGVYRYTRNPMYLGMLVILLAWAVWLASPPALVGVPVFWWYIGRFQIRPEERALATLFGNSFGDYTSRVRRWL
jgi:protein-S-isoprenylcysteine O-methyltransferase Ste14